MKNKAKTSNPVIDAAEDEAPRCVKARTLGGRREFWTGSAWSTQLACAERRDSWPVSPREQCLTLDEAILADCEAAEVLRADEALIAACDAHYRVCGYLDMVGEGAPPGVRALALRTAERLRRALRVAEVAR
jgi:hypothetical protein